MSNIQFLTFDSVHAMMHGVATAEENGRIKHLSSCTIDWVFPVLLLSFALHLEINNLHVSDIL